MQDCLTYPCQAINSIPRDDCCKHTSSHSSNISLGRISLVKHINHTADISNPIVQKSVTLLVELHLRSNPRLRMSDTLVHPVIPPPPLCTLCDVKHVPVHDPDHCTYLAECRPQAWVTTGRTLPYVIQNAADSRFCRAAEQQLQTPCCVRPNSKARILGVLPLLPMQPRVAAPFENLPGSVAP